MRRKPGLGLWGGAQPQTTFLDFIRYSVRFNSWFNAFWKLICKVYKTNKKAVLSQGNRAMPQLLFLV